MHDLLPPAINVAALQSLTPIYLNFSLASFFPPLHMITATSFSFITASTPIIWLTFFVTSAPPDVQAFVRASPLIIALANPAHPGNPQAPQFVPGRTLITASSLGSNFTKNFLEARERLTPNTKPSTPSPKIAYNIKNNWTQINAETTGFSQMSFRVKRGISFLDSLGFALRMTVLLSSAQICINPVNLRSNYNPNK